MKRRTDPLVGILECNECPFANIRGSDDRNESVSLEPNVHREIAGLSTLDGKEWATNILNEEVGIQPRMLDQNWPWSRRVHVRSARDTAFLEVVVDTGLGVKVRNTRVIKGNPDKMLHPSLLRGINEVFALLLLSKEARPDYRRKI
jgi:hypothetical protein